MYLVFIEMIKQQMLTKITTYVHLSKKSRTFRKILWIQMQTVNKAYNEPGEHLVNKQTKSSKFEIY
jgi:hypothetical protein